MFVKFVNFFNHCTKNEEVFIKDFFSKYDQIHIFTFTVEILYEKLYFLCIVGLPIHHFIKSGLEGGGAQKPFALTN